MLVETLNHARPALSLTDRVRVLVPAHETPALIHRRRIRHVTPLLGRLTRYLGGTYSPTVDRVVFTDGSDARTDLIRVNPSIAAYSIDFDGLCPRHPAPYRAASWSRVLGTEAHRQRARIALILRSSFPTLSTAELSRRLRAAGVPLGEADIKEHEAIAGTQAAIWNLTNGLQLDDRPLTVPVRAVSSDSRTGVATELDPGADGGLQVALAPAATVHLDLTFAGRPQLGGFAVRVHGTSGGAVRLSLQKSGDDRTWGDVAGSTMEIRPGAVADAAGTALADAAGTAVVEYRRPLPAGATVSSATHVRGPVGYDRYRLVVQNESGTEEPIEITSIRFWFVGSPAFRNAERTALLYRYLLGLHASGPDRLRPPAIRLAADRGASAPGMFGPFVLDSDVPCVVAVREGHAGQLFDRDGVVSSGRLEPGAQFYVGAAHSGPYVGAAQSGPRRMPALTVSVPAETTHEARVLLSDSGGENGRMITPLVIAVPVRREVLVDVEVGSRVSTPARLTSTG